VEIGCRNGGWAGVAVGLRRRGRCVGGMFWLGHSDDGLSGGVALGARSRSGGYFSGSLIGCALEEGEGGGEDRHCEGFWWL
jgi:hypothetical protein